MQLQEITLFLTVGLSDFNIKPNLWFKGDKTSNEGSKIDAITSQLGLQQLINEPTHLVADSSSCIDLIFMSHPNLVIESGVFIVTSKLSSLNKLCKIQSKNSLSPSIRTGNMALRKS